MKKIDKFWYWFLCVIAVVICFMFGTCLKVSATNFTLSDGTISEITYNENQILEGSYINNHTQLIISYDTNNQKYTIIKSAYKSFNSIYYYINCTYSNNVITCQNYYYITSTTTGNQSSITGIAIPTFTINMNSVFEDGFVHDATYNIEKSYTETDIENAYQEGQNSVDKQAYADKYIQDNNYHTHEDYLNYGNNKYTEGIEIGSNGVDITIDNQEYTDKYIQDNNYHTHEDYLNYGEIKYEEGQNSIDITKDNQAYANKYIQDNNYKTLQEYIDFGISKYNEGQHSVDITKDNQAYAEQYIIDNNYHSDSEYQNYGNNKYTEGYNGSATSYLNVVKDKVITLFPNNTISENVCTQNTSGSIVCDEAIEKYIQTTYNLSNSIGYQNGVASVDIKGDNQAYAEQYIIDNNYHSDSEYQNYGSNQYNNGVTYGKSIGYEQANKDGKVLGTFIPNLLGGFGSFFLTILNIDILGFNLLSVLGIFITILGVIVVIKFLKG